MADTAPPPHTAPAAATPFVAPSGWPGTGGMQVVASVRRPPARTRYNLAGLPTAGPAAVALRASGH